MKLVFINYSFLSEYNSPESWIKRIHPFVLVMQSLSKKCETIYVGQINYVGDYLYNGVQYHFLDSAEKKSYFPFSLHRFVKALQPDVVIVLGVVFPIQVLQLQFFLHRKVPVIVQHEANPPFHGFRKLIQQMADRFVDAYLFTSKGLAKEWLYSGNIRNAEKCREISVASTDFFRQDKEQSRLKTRISEALNYLWVGRLNKNKDPMTVLSGFEKYLSVQPAAKLHFIYFTTDLLPEMERKIETSVLLKNAVFLHGHIPYDEMPVWYSAADFFISGSHREGGSYALFEAMSCGCIPIVTAIPPALTVIDNGRYGFYYPPGDANGLFEQLVVSAGISAIEFSRSVESHFQQTMSPEAIADRLFLIAKELTVK